MRLNGGYIYKRIVNGWMVNGWMVDLLLKEWMVGLLRDKKISDYLQRDNGDTQWS